MRLKAGRHFKFRRLTALMFITSFQPPLPLWDTDASFIITAGFSCRQPAERAADTSTLAQIFSRVCGFIPNSERPGICLHLLLAGLAWCSLQGIGSLTTVSCNNSFFDTAQKGDRGAAGAGEARSPHSEGQKVNGSAGIHG